jgi:hypothetical protein
MLTPARAHFGQALLDDHSCSTSVPLACGSYRPFVDADCVSRLRDSKLCLQGSSVMTHVSQTSRALGHLLGPGKIRVNDSLKQHPTRMSRILETVAHELDQAHADALARATGGVI